MVNDTKLVEDKGPTSVTAQNPVGSPSSGKKIESQPATFNPLKVLGAPNDHLEPLIEDGNSDDDVKSSSDEIHEAAE